MSKNIYIGISLSHESGACLIKDGVLISAINEERLTRKKMQSGFPDKAIRKILEDNKLLPNNITGIGVAGRINLGEMPLKNDFTISNGQVKLSQKIAEFLDSIPILSNLIRSKFLLNSYRLLTPIVSKKYCKTAQNLKKMGFTCPISYFDHHECHIASGYYFFSDKDALIISNDGFGDGLCSLVAKLKNHRITSLNRISFFNSIGTYYNFATKICGFKYFHHAGKTTGLAAFGKAEKTYKIFSKYIGWNASNGSYVNKKGIFRNALKELEKDLTEHKIEDVAAGVQKLLEETIVKYVKFHLKKNNKSRLILVGGVHANVKANQRIAQLQEVEKLYIYPAMSDAGLAAGAAWLISAKKFSPEYMPKTLPNVYLGPCFTDDEIENELKKSRINFYKSSDVITDTAKLLADKKIVARFSGRMEYGPRSLGNRSILYTAEDATVNKWLNEKLQRTEFMPFAPILRDIDAESFLISYDAKTAKSAEFMTITFDVTKKCIEEAPAAVHVDNTARPQIVTEKSNPDLYKILSEYKRLTGKSILVNTSFNMHEEPIVCTPYDAINAFVSGSLDYLIIGSYVCSQKEYN